MAAQPQPPQQPIFPNDLANAIDRTYARTVTLIDARIDGLATQMRVDKLEMIELINTVNQASIQRDQDLANLVLAFREENRRQNEGMLQLIRDLHAEAMESINKLRQAVNELKEKGSQ